MNKRIEWVDTTKAFACFLVIIGHLLQSFQKSGIDFYPSITTKIIDFIYLLHMPLFMCLSGYLYCRKNNKFSLNEYKKFEFNKIVNFIIPYVTFYTIFILLNMLFSSSVNTSRGIEDLLKMFYNPLAPYWFLYTLLALFIFVPIVEKILKYDKKIVFSLFVLLKIISIFIYTKVFIIDSIMRWAIYFYLGVFISNDRLKINTLICTISYLLIGAIYIIYISGLSNIIDGFAEMFFGINGSFICIEIFKRLKNNYFLDSFKKYTFQIFLLHTIFAAALRILLIRFGITNYFIHLIIGIISSIYFPVLVSIICKKTKYFNFFFYPIKTIEELKKQKEVG